MEGQLDIAMLLLFAVVTHQNNQARNSEQKSQVNCKEKWVTNIPQKSTLHFQIISFLPLLWKLCIVQVYSWTS